MTPPSKPTPPTPTTQPSLSSTPTSFHTQAPQSPTPSHTPHSPPGSLLPAFKPDRNLVDFYITKLSSIAAEEITIDASQACAAIGVEACQELSISIFTMTTDMMGGKKKSRSLIPPNKRVVISGLAKFNRVAFLNALRAVK